MVDADALRTELETEADNLSRQIERIDPTVASEEFDDNFADSGQVAAERGENRVLYDQLKRDLDDVEAALERMDKGTYGQCETCGGPIGDARLEAMPATRFCINDA